MGNLFSPTAHQPGGVEGLSSHMGATRTKQEDWVMQFWTETGHWWASTASGAEEDQAWGEGLQSGLSAWVTSLWDIRA